MSRLNILWFFFLPMLIPCGGRAGPGDAQVHFHRGLAAEDRGDLKSASKLYKKACMAEDGLAEGCLRWAKLSDGPEQSKERKRALGSAVMLDPKNVESRYLLAKLLLEKEDYVWAIENLLAAQDAATHKSNQGLIGYYLGYAQYKNGDLEAAGKNLERARAHLPPPLRQRCLYYLALVALEQGNQPQGFQLLRKVADGPSEKWSRAAEDRMYAESAFPKRHWYSGLGSISLGINTHPSSAFLDDPGGEASPVLQSVFRTDVLLGVGTYRDALSSSITLYREQNWTELKKQKSDSDLFSPQDLNTTLFLGQLGYLRRAWLSGKEHEILFGAEGQAQMLDHIPVKTGNQAAPLAPSDKAFQVYGWAIALKLWWTVATSRDAVYSGRLKFENWTNDMETNRSALRLRFRLTHTRYFLSRTLRLNALAGLRYDRTYRDPYIIKYDRLLPEAQAQLQYRTPVPRLTLHLGTVFKYNWYLNSRGNQANSFRPAAPQLTSEQLRKYHDLARHDIQWEISGDVQVALWKKAAALITYVHHQRISNMDGAWRQPDIDATDYGYTRDVVMLELRQGF